MKKIVAILGTNSSKSTNALVLENVKEILKDKANVEIIDIKNIPYLDYGQMGQPPLETMGNGEDKAKINFENSDFSSPLLPIIKSIDEASGIILSSVEYLHAPSSSLMNFLVWMSLPPYCMKDKPLFLLSANHGRTGSIKALAILRQILEDEKLSPMVFPKNFILNESLSSFNQDGSFVDDKDFDNLKKDLDDFLVFIDRARVWNEAK